MNLVIVSGLSGAGKSQVVKCMEDMGFYCIDNIPAVLIPKIAQVCISSDIENLALVTDLRGKQMFNDVYSAMDMLIELGIKYRVLFLEASDNVLVKRFSETRRKHPLVSENNTVLNAINEERQLLSSIRKIADDIVDTSNLTVNELKEQIINIFNSNKKYEGLVTHIMSFGFKYGAPVDADLVFDVRFLPNPYYEPELKPHSGLDEDVYNFVYSYEQTKEFLKKLTDMVEFLYPHYINEGKSQLVIAIGCTGGRHRSVAIAKGLFDKLKESGHNIFLRHRDIDKVKKG